MITTIQINGSLKERLNKLKIHHRETYNELIERIINEFSKNMIDKESLNETLEIMSDPQAMRDIAEASERIQKGDLGISLEEVKKELGL